MLSRQLKRALLDSRWAMPPIFLLPWAASLTTVSHTADSNALPPPPATPRRAPSQQKTELRQSGVSSPHSYQSDNAPPLPPPSSKTSSPVSLSPSIRELLPLLQAQAPHYITIHIHGKPYLLTQGDTLKLPFYMHGVEPGDVLRLNRAVNIGSREYTLKAAAPRERLKSPTTDTKNIGMEAMITQLGGEGKDSHALPAESGGPMGQNVIHAPHFIPHIEKGKHSYLNDRLFVCRAVVMGVESEPLRIKEKTKRRQRRVKTVKSKHRFTILKIKELRVKTVEEIEDNNID